MQSATYPLSMSTYAFRSFDDNEDKRSSEENARIEKWVFDGTTNAVIGPVNQECASTAFGVTAKPTGTYNLALEDAIDGRRQKKYDYVPAALQNRIPKPASLDALDTQPTPLCSDNQFLQPINTHRSRFTRGAVVTDIQVRRNDALAIPSAPLAYVYGNRPQVGVNARRTARDSVAYEQRRLKLNAEAQKRRETGLSW